MNHNYAFLALGMGREGVGRTCSLKHRPSVLLSRELWYMHPQPPTPSRVLARGYVASFSKGSGLFSGDPGQLGWVHTCDSDGEGG